jgi:hypothetical protein
VLCYTGQNLFDKYEREITDFLDGLTFPLDYPWLKVKRIGEVSRGRFRA